MQYKSMLLLVLLSLGFVMGFGLTVFIDGSGSMTGFARTGAIKEQVEDIIKASEDHSFPVNIIIFSSQTPSAVSVYKARIDELNNPDLFSGKYTLLGKMSATLLEKGDAGNYVVITDNVEDSAESRGDTALFYNSLVLSDNIVSVDVLPELRQFSGNPCRGNNKNFGGKAGLLVYLITKGSGKTPISQNILKNLKAGGSASFHIRPVNSNHINISSIKSSNSEFVLYSKNGKYFLKLKPGKSKIPTLQIDKHNDIKFSIRMHSKYDYIGIKKNTEIKITNFRIVSGGMPVNIEHPRIKVTPSRLKSNLEKGESQLFEAVISLKPTKPALMQRIIALFDPKLCSISFDIQLGTSSNSLYMNDTIRRQYFTSNFNEYSKIYSPVDIISYFNPQGSNLTFHVANENVPSDNRTKIVLVYDNGWLFFWLVLILLSLILGTIFLINWLRSPDKLFVTISSNDGLESKNLVLKKYQVINNQIYTIRRKLSECTININEKTRFYFKGSVFYKLDIPLRTLIEILDKKSEKIIKISIDKKGSNDV